MGASTWNYHSLPIVTASETQVGEGGATCPGECAGEGLDSVNHCVYSSEVPALFPDLATGLV